MKLGEHLARMNDELEILDTGADPTRSPFLAIAHGLAALTKIQLARYRQAKKLQDDKHLVPVMAFVQVAAPAPLPLRPYFGVGGGYEVMVLDSRAAIRKTLAESVEALGSTSGRP